MDASSHTPSGRPGPQTPADTGTASADPVSVAPGAVVYAERLTPSWWIWTVAAMVASFAILVLTPINLATGIGAAVALFILEAILLVTTTPRLEVTENLLRVGRATIERRHLGPVTGYRGDDATYQRGPALHGRAFLCIRGWIDPVVRIQITDERDLTPYWLASTRHPEDLVSVLGGSMARDAENIYADSDEPEETDEIDDKIDTEHPGR